jgi:uncharacterized protein (TIGR00730 family)
MKKQQEVIVTVFGSANVHPDDDSYKHAEEIGSILAKNNYTVCTGGYGGIMEAVSRGAKNASGKTMGITIDSKGVKPNKYIDENVIMPNWVERLMEMIAIGDMYLIFRGGSGTLVELSVALEMMNKKIMKEKLIILFGAYWQKVLETLKLDSQQLRSVIDRTVIVANQPEEVLNILKKPSY